MTICSIPNVLNKIYWFLVNKYEMMGAVFANLLIMFILCTLLAISLIIGIKKQKSKGEKKWIKK